MSTDFWIALGSIATAIVVLINLWLVVFKPRWEKPKFSIGYGDREPYCRHTSSRKIHSGTDRLLGDSWVYTLWIRVRVTNSGRSVAKRCLAKLVSVADGHGVELESFDPTQLNWAGASWEARPFETIDLDRGDYEYLNVLLTQASNENIYFAGTELPWTACEKRGITGKLPPGVYVLKITVYGDDVDPQTKHLALLWGGNDKDDVAVELHDGLDDAKGWLAKQKRQSGGS